MTIDQIAALRNPVAATTIAAIRVPLRPSTRGKQCADCGEKYQYQDNRCHVISPCADPARAKQAGSMKDCRKETKEGLVSRTDQLVGNITTRWFSPDRENRVRISRAVEVARKGNLASVGPNTHRADPNRLFGRTEAQNLPRRVPIPRAESGTSDITPRRISKNGPKRGSRLTVCADEEAHSRGILRKNDRRLACLLAGAQLHHPLRVGDPVGCGVPS